MKTFKCLLFCSALLLLFSCGNREDSEAEALNQTPPVSQNRILKYMGPPSQPPGMGLTTQNGQILTRDGAPVVYANGRIERILSTDQATDSFRFIYDNGQLKEIQRLTAASSGPPFITKALRMFYTGGRLTRVVDTFESFDSHPDTFEQPSSITDLTYDGTNISAMSVKQGKFSMAGGAQIFHESYKAQYQYGNSYKNPFGTLPKELQIFNAHFGRQIFGDGLLKYYFLSENPPTSIVYTPFTGSSISRTYIYETDAAGYPTTLREPQSSFKEVFLYDTW